MDEPDPPLSLSPVHCRGCGRRLGYAPLDYRIYCTEFCATDYPVGAMEDRDALVEALYLTKRLKPGALGRLFGISRQRVDQILRSREIR